jgi:molybdate transport system ATP-binding protein
MSITLRFALERDVLLAKKTARFDQKADPFRLDVELSVPKGCVGVVGASGSGKTTLLRCIAGLEPSARGTLRVHDAIWQDERVFLPVYRRSVGYVFQEPSLFPHLSVRENLLFGQRRVPAEERRISFDDAVALLGAEPLLARDPSSLSGGERQRVAIARALLTSPKLLLLDEPLASLDIESRAQILPYLEGVQRALSVPMLYVTHSPNELARIAQRVVLLAAGRVEAEGPLNELLTRPDLGLSQREDAGAVLDAKVEEHDAHHHLTYLRVQGARVLISRRALAVGEATRLLVRARDVSLAREKPVATSINNVLEVSVRGVHDDRDPAYRLVTLDLAGSTLLARITALSLHQLGLKPGERVFALVKSAALIE